MVVGTIDDISCQRRRLHQTGWNQRSGRVHTCFTTLIYDLGRIRRVIEDSSAHLCIIDTVKAETQQYTSCSSTTWSTQSTRIVPRVSSIPTILRLRPTESVFKRHRAAIVTLCVQSISGASLVSYFETVSSSGILANPEPLEQDRSRDLNPAEHTRQPSWKREHNNQIPLPPIQDFSERRTLSSGVSLDTATML